MHTLLMAFAVWMIALAQASPLALLEHRTAWITVLITVPGYPAGDSDIFTTVKPAGREVKVPSVGDEIQLKREQELFIVGIAGRVSVGASSSPGTGDSCGTTW